MVLPGVVLRIVVPPTCYLCDCICSCRSSAACDAICPSPAAAPPSGCSLCDLEGSKPQSAYPPHPPSCRRTTGWDARLVGHRGGGGRDLSRRCRAEFGIVFEKSERRRSSRGTRRPTTRCYRPSLSCILHDHLVVLGFGRGVRCRFGARAQHVLRQAKAVILYKQRRG